MKEHSDVKTPWKVAVCRHVVAGVKQKCEKLRLKFDKDFLLLSFNYRDIDAITPIIYFSWYTTDIFRTINDIPRIFFII